MLDKLFGWNKKKEEPEPVISFGRYSDNNKPNEKVTRWNDADAFFKDKKYIESFSAFFDYLRDDAVQNVLHERDAEGGRFELFQGSKIVRGRYNNEYLQAEATLAKMPQPSVPVMRRLLEMNFNLYYGRFALDNDRLCMRFDSSLSGANPNKLYYGLKELATKADKQDDLLVQDFTILQTLDTEHIRDIPQQQKEIKYQYWIKWIRETLDYVATLDADKFSGGIAYLLLSLAYRLDYLISPEGKLMNELEKIVEIYFRKDERPAQDKNRDMIEGYNKLATKSQQEIFPYLFTSKYTFAITSPQVYKTIADSMYNSNQNITWYRDNNYPLIAEKICEYGISYCQYSYSLPRPITELFQLFMMVNYCDYFAALGFREKYYDIVNKQFNVNAIIERIRQVQDKWKAKYPNLWFKTENLRFDSLLNFNLAFTNELQFLNMEIK
ncbi:MAG: hypothetical protein QM764_06145 [Chitinophagaceae bacterium]